MGKQYRNTLDQEKKIRVVAKGKKSQLPICNAPDFEEAMADEVIDQYDTHIANTLRKLKERT